MAITEELSALRDDTLTAIAAAETALAIAIIINIFRSIKTVDVQGIDKMKF